MPSHFLVPQVDHLPNTVPFAEGAATDEPYNSYNMDKEKKVQ